MRVDIVRLDGKSALLRSRQAATERTSELPQLRSDYSPA